MMQPFQSAEVVRTAYRKYIETSYPLRDPELKRKFEQLIDDGKLLWQEPYISLSRPFRMERNFLDLVSEGLLEPDITRIHWPFDQLFNHQVVAIRRLSTRKTPRNTLIATGTGSGKTEAFIIPIVDDCLRNPNPPGVRAVLVYPMNALVNDQLDRLRCYLVGTGVTFGRYTGDTPTNEADASKKGIPRPAGSPAEEVYHRVDFHKGVPPQILITNYSMLELLLLRREDQKIFRGVKPRYLVMDEVHTYTGILGSEVACLIRRLKEHAGVKPGELVCVGTSATIGADQKEQLLHFASNLFGEHFDADAVIEEEYEPIRWPESPHYDRPHSIKKSDLKSVDVEDETTIRKLAEKTLGIKVESSGPEFFDALYDQIESRSVFAEMEELLQTPKPLSAIAALLKKLPGRDKLGEQALEHEATALLLLGCAASKRDPKSQPRPRFRPKVHVIIRSLSPLARCLEQSCDELLTDGQTECTCDIHGYRTHPKALTLEICRACGSDYLLGWVDSSHVNARHGLSANCFILPEEVGNVSLQDIHLYRGRLADLLDDEEDEAPATAREVAVCPYCLHGQVMRTGDEAPQCANEKCPHYSKADLPVYVAFLSAARCPHCQAQGKGRRPEIITPMRGGAASAVAVLAQNLFPTLSENEKRILIFADSRQDTAHQAGFLRDRHQVFTQRQIVYQAHRERENAGASPIALPQLAQETFLSARAEFGEHEALNMLTPLTASPEGFLDENLVISNQMRDMAIKRLEWDLALEFSERADARYSLEREGLMTVTYSGLHETARAALPLFAAFEITKSEYLAVLIRAVIDQLRVKKAINYVPFTDYLHGGADWVRRGIARPTRYNRTPIGFDRDKSGRRGAYEVTAWYNRNNPQGHQTAIYNLVSRAYPAEDPNRITALIDTIIRLLLDKGYLVHEQIGKKSTGRFGNITTHSHQLRYEYLEVTTTGERYRCPSCGRTRGYVLYSWETGQAICGTYRCSGSPESYQPDAHENFYVELYKDMRPERLYPVEHSGQLSNEERIKIEDKFRRGAINTLVCTPTLELGVNIGDLPSLILRNIPPTPSNYAQRAGRAGRARRVALILAHAGQNPHDSHFFNHPEEMITGQIKPPVFLLDNEVVINRHLNSLILEKLSQKLPDRWRELASDEGQLLEQPLRDLQDEVGTRRAEIRQAVADAFVRERESGGLPWLDGEYIEHHIEGFMPALRDGLKHWCQRYQDIYQELARSRRIVRPTAEDQKRERELNAALSTLENDQRYYPLSYLADVGVLPRYGFSGNRVAVRDSKEREISQSAVVGIVEYAPGNQVYVGGRKLYISQVAFRQKHENAQDNATVYRYCRRCNFVTIPEPGEALLTQVCPFCGDFLNSGYFVDYEAARGYERELITQDDEYRTHEDYDLATYLRPTQSSTTLETKIYGDMQFEYSRLRNIEVFNRGRRDRASGQTEPFTVCLECGAVRREGGDSDTAGNVGHLQSCSVTTWNSNDDPRIIQTLHLRVSLKGDIIEIPIPQDVVHDEVWITTFDEALKMGAQLYLSANVGEINSFIRRWLHDEQENASLVLFDSMPGGTGYLKRMLDQIPQIALSAVEHLLDCDCERACYVCLKDFRNQRKHNLLDKTVVIPVLKAIGEC